jgi:hypothetical protein
MGGLGLFDIKTFLDAQRITWVKRAREVNDLWKISLYSRCYGSVFNIRSQDYSSETEPCLHTIVSSYERFMTYYTKYGKNYKESFLYNNKSLNLGIRNNSTLNRNLYTDRFWNEHGNKIKG